MERAEYEKLRWRCIRRALLELDVVLTRFLDEEFPSLDEDSKQAFVELADLEDWDLWPMISGQVECENPRLAPLVAKLRKS